MILDGKSLAKKIETDLKKQIQEEDFKLKFAVVLVGQNPASKKYVAMKEKACLSVGIDFEKISFSETESEEGLLEKIEELNKDSSVTGILVQLPLPKQFSVERVIEKISPQKDVDGFTSENLGKLFLGTGDFLAPATPSGILKLLKEYKVEIKGKNAVVVGKSNIVGKPVSLMLLSEGATVTTCHSLTQNLEEFTKKADILVVATGVRNLIKKEMVKEGAVVVDVGINSENGKLYGDTDFEEIKKVASKITPVPGGVGPMTVASLLENVVKAKRLALINTMSSDGDK